MRESQCCELRVPLLQTPLSIVLIDKGHWLLGKESTSVHPALPPDTQGFPPLALRDNDGLGAACVRVIGQSMGIQDRRSVVVVVVAPGYNL